jgi:hypothetical protein
MQGKKRVEKQVKKRAKKQKVGGRVADESGARKAGEEMVGGGAGSQRILA